MAWKDIPGKQYWQFKDDPQLKVLDYLSRATSRRNPTITNNGVRTLPNGRQVYVQTRYVGPGSTDTDNTNRGEIDVNFHLASIGNAGVKPASFFSSLPAVGGGGGGGQPSIGIDASYDTEFGYLVGNFSVDTSFWNASFIEATGTQLQLGTIAGNRYMPDADFQTVMSDATHITFIFVDTTGGTHNVTPSARTFAEADSKGAVVFTKDAICTTPNVKTFTTTGLQQFQLPSANNVSQIWHNEDTGSDLTGADFSYFGVPAGEAKIVHESQSSVGFNQVSNQGGTVVGSSREYTAATMQIWVTNSGVAPVLS